MNQELQQLSLTLLPTEDVRALYVRCIEEDGGVDGDVTTRSIGSKDKQVTLAINVRGEGIVAGLEPLARMMRHFASIELKQVCDDGECVQDATIGILSGSMQSILGAERTILNILGHASGIATHTRRYVDLLVNTGCVVCDTRKTTPGLRLLDKYDVACGGGVLHRLGLHDAALFKDNHLAEMRDLSTELESAIAIARSSQQLKFVEVEVDSLSQLREVLLLDVDIILLDNMVTEQLQEAVKLRDVSVRKPTLEASGGITFDTVVEIAMTGVDRVAIGDLTHHAQWIDIGLDSIHE